MTANVQPASPSGSPRLTGVRLLAVLLLPWAFLAFFGFMYRTFLWPQLTSGHLVGICVGAFVGLVLVSFVVAAVTFSRDVLAGRYPAS